jgi:hypothetical protein
MLFSSPGMIFINDYYLNAVLLSDCDGEGDGFGGEFLNSSLLSEYDGDS